MATVKKTKKYQLGGLLKGVIKSGVKSVAKNAEKNVAKDIGEGEMKQAFKEMERQRLKSMFKDIEAKEAAKKAVPKQKSGGKVMLKRKDGSTSQRGLWDNIRAAKGSGKKPTAAMLKQEKKIKAKTKK